MTVVVRRRILHIGPKKVVITWCVAAVLQEHIRNTLATHWQHIP